MLTQRLLVLCAAGACSVLLGIAGCNTPTSGTSGGAPSVSPASQQETLRVVDAKELAAAKQASVNNLHQLAIAMHAYRDVHGVFPTPGYVADSKQPPPALPWDPISWRVKLLPYLEQQKLYEQIQPPLPIPVGVANTSIPEFANPLAKSPSVMTHYRVFVGGGAFFEPNRPTRETDTLDGTRNTILIVEAAEPVDWSKPEELRFDPTKPLPKLGIFPDGFHAVMVDGSIRWISSTVPEADIKKMITRAADDFILLPDDQLVRSTGLDARPRPIPKKARTEP